MEKDFVKRLREEMKDDKLAGIICGSIIEGFLISYNDIIICCNKSLADMFGYKVEELKDAKIQILFPDITEEEIKECFKKGGVVVRGRKKDGTPFMVYLRGSVIPYLGKQLHSFALQDVTETERYRYTIREGEERYRVLTESMLDGIVITDFDGRILYANPTALDMFGFKDIKEIQKKRFFDFVLPDFIEKARADIELVRSGDKVSFLVEYQAMDVNKNPFWVEVITSRTLFGEKERVLICLRDITERKLAEESLKRMQERMKGVLEETVIALSKTIAEKDPYTSEHQKRVSKLSCAIAEKMNLPLEILDGLRIASILHDIGKIYIPGEILSAPRRLTEIEMALVRLHPVKGYNILRDIDFPWPVADIVLQHHERMDGSGYPLGIDDDNILLEARILAVSDVVEAMSSHRPYRSSLGIKSALEEIELKKGIHYDEKVVDACIKLFETGFTL